jgi:predicted SAM-dependent methyltransferase
MGEQLVKLYVGCGPIKLKGWINIDISGTPDVILDVTKSFPYSDNYVDFIYNKAFYEHLTVKQGVDHLKDCLRVLKNGGVLRIATPDLETMLCRYVDNTWRNQYFVVHSGAKTRAEAVNWRFYEGYGHPRGGSHRYLYDEEELGRRVVESGFGTYYRCKFNISTYPDLCGLESSGGWDDPEMLIMEVVKQ